LLFNFSTVADLRERRATSRLLACRPIGLKVTFPELWSAVGATQAKWNLNRLLQSFDLDQPEASVSEARIVGVALLAAAVEGRRISVIERCARAQALDEVRIGHVQPVPGVLRRRAEHGRPDVRQRTDPSGRSSPPTGQAAFAMLVEAVEAATDVKDPQAIVGRTIAFWSTLFGLARLSRNQLLDPFQPDPPVDWRGLVVEEAVASVLRGRPA